MKSFKYKVAAITGAGSGIGRALALALSEQGCHVALSDIDEKGLLETVNLIHSGVNVTHHIVDVSKREAVYDWAEQIVADHGQVNMIFNNAGVALGDTVENISYEDFEWLMNINFWGVVYGTKAFLPHLEASGDGHIINISSLFGLVGMPTQSAYNAAKFAVRGFTESLQEELSVAGSCVHAISVHPGGIKTNIARNSRVGVVSMNGDQELDHNKEYFAERFDQIARTSPKSAASTILKGIRKNKLRVLIGPDALVMDGMQRLLPESYQKLVVFGAKRVV